MIDIEEYREKSYEIVGAIFEVHRELGPGLNEYVYQEGLAMQLAESGIAFEREVSFHPNYHGRPMQAEYRMDFVCQKETIIECKAVLKLVAEHRAQLFNYMRLTKMPVGILVNFANKSAHVERYFFNAETQEIYGSDGLPVTRFATFANVDCAE